MYLGSSSAAGASHGAAAAAPAMMIAPMRQVLVLITPQILAMAAATGPTAPPSLPPLPIGPRAPAVIPQPPKPAWSWDHIPTSFHGAVKDREFTDAEVDRLARYQMATIEKCGPVAVSAVVSLFVQLNLAVSCCCCCCCCMHAPRLPPPPAPALRPLGGTRHAGLLGHPIRAGQSVRWNARRSISSAVSGSGVLHSACPAQQPFCTGTVPPSRSSSGQTELYVCCMVSEVVIGPHGRLIRWSVCVGMFDFSMYGAHQKMIDLESEGVQAFLRDETGSVISLCNDGNVYCNITTFNWVEPRVRQLWIETVLNATAAGIDGIFAGASQ
jgi:hypothetical protein